MADQLSDEELAELLSSLGNRPRSPSPPGDSVQVPRTYDFRRPQRVNKEQSRLLENLHEQFARLMASTLAGSMRMVVDVDLAFSDQVLYSEFVLILPQPCTAYTFLLDPPGGKAVLSFSAELLMAIIDRAFGGKGIGSADQARPLSPIETNLINKLVIRIVQDLEATWEVGMPIHISEIALETNPEFIRIAHSGDPALLFAFEVHTSRASGLIHLCYPLTTLDPLLPRLISRQQPSRPAAKGAAVLRARAFDKLKVPVVIRLARGTLPLKEVAKLQKGDIVKLDTAKDEPAVVFLGKQPKFLGKPGLDGRKRAVKIVKTIAAEEEDLFR